MAWKVELDRAAVREADADLGFMARTMALCSLPRSNPGNRKRVQARQRPLHALHGRGRW